MKRKYAIYPIALVVSLFFFSCNKESKTPLQKEREQIMEIENLLRDNNWGFYDMSLSIKYEMSAPPFLANVADENGMVQPGEYDSYTIFGNSNRQLKYVYKFSRDNVMVDTNYLESYYKVATYYVVDLTKINLNIDSARRIKFNYVYLPEENKFVFNADKIYNEKIINTVNEIIINSILEGRPIDIANKFVELLQNNEKFKQGIEQFLYDLIHGKIEEITTSPDEAAEKIAELIVEKLKEIDWELVLYDRILESLYELQQENPEEKALEIAGKIAEKIEASVSKNDIYETLLPILQEFEEETLPVLASRIATSVYELLTDKLSEQNLYDRIYPLWVDLIQLDSTIVSENADTLAGAVTAHFFDVNDLTQKFIPLVERVDETPSLQLGQLSQEIIDTLLIPKVNLINENFPGLDLNPNWSSVKPIITSFLTVIKSQLNDYTVEELAESLANSIIGLMNGIIKIGFENAIFALQEIPAEQAASVIASWVTNLLEIAEVPVVEFIEGKLNDILMLFEAEKTALTVSAIIYNKILEVFGEENLIQFIQPLLESLQEADIEEISAIIARWIVELDLLADEVTEDDLVEWLTENLVELIGTINPDQATDKLVELILSSNLVEQIDGNVLKTVIIIKIDELQRKVTKEVNAVENIEIIINRE